MSEPTSRPRDALAIHYGIVLPEEVARRFDQGVARAAARLPALLLQAPAKPPGFAAPKTGAPRDE